MRISKHISWSEGTKSQTATRHGIDNDPNPAELESMIALAEAVFEPLRDHFATPIAITSFFRHRVVNEIIGGSKTSQHCKGEAMDIDADVFGGLKNSQIFEFIKDNLPFDQMIWEYGTELEPAWVHVSYKRSGNRKQLLKVERIGGKSVYSEYV